MAFTVDDTLIAKAQKAIKVDWSKVDLNELKMGIPVELEHGTKTPATNVTQDDPIVTVKIALAHLLEIPDYYTRLKKMEDEGKAAKAINELTTLFEE